MENGYHRYENQLLREKELFAGILEDFAEQKVRSVPSTPLLDLAKDINGISSVHNMSTLMRTRMTGESRIQDVASDAEMLDMFEKNQCSSDNDSVSSNENGYDMIIKWQLETCNKTIGLIDEAQKQAGGLLNDDQFKNFLFYAKKNAIELRALANAVEDAQSMHRLQSLVKFSAVYE